MAKYRSLGRLQLDRQQLLLEREIQLKETEEKVLLVTQNKQTKKQVLDDFSEVAEFFSSKFPNLDLSDILIYLASSSVMDKSGFKMAGGVFIAHMNTILLRDKVLIQGGKVTRFEKEMDRHIKAEVLSRDVLVHEMLHAVSYKTRSGRNFTFGEEEFVYTNCVEFYKKTGLSEDEIVSKNFLPFCIMDVLSDSKEMIQVFNIIRSQGINLPDMTKLSSKSYRKLMNDNADKVVPLLVERAKEKGHQMIYLYNKYGSHQIHSNDAPKNDASMRFQGIDLDDDW